MPPKGSENNRAMRRRLQLLLLLVFGALTVLGMRAFQLQIELSKEFQLRSELNVQRIINIPAPRGNIYDRNGVLLARSYPSLDVLYFAVRREMDDETARNLAELLGVSVEEIHRRLHANFERPYEPILLQEDVSFEIASELEERREAFTGAFIGATPRRVYHYPEATFHIMGYVREISSDELEQREHLGYLQGDLIGKEGLERQYESALRGRRGARTVEVNARGELMKILGETAPVAGTDIWLTIDIRLQQKLFDLLKQHYETEDMTTDPRKVKGTPAVAAALDPRNGDVLALASYPIPDHVERFSRPMTAAQWNSYVLDPGKPLINRAIKGTYPPGSTFKVVTALAGLAEGQIDRKTKYYCGGGFRLGRTFHCWRRSGHGWVDVLRSLYDSCDVFYYRMADQMGIEPLARWSRQLGIGQLTGIDLPGERPGIMPDPEWKMRLRGEPWYGGETINTVIGQGDVLTTPLHMAHAVAAVANRGFQYRPHLLLRIDGREDFVSEKILHDNIPREHFETVIEGMQRAVDSGTATRSRVRGLSVAGKTGTSQVLSSDTPQDYFFRKLHAWYVSFAPVDDPQMVVSVICERSGYGGRWAAPIARQLFEAALEYGIIEPRKSADSGSGSTSG